MNEQNFDDQLRGSLGDYHSKLDTDALWKQLEPQLTADKKRRRGIFWWWSGVGLLALTLVAGAYLLRDRHELLSTASEQTTAQPQANQSEEATTPVRVTEAEVETATASGDAVMTPAEVTVPAEEVVPAEQAAVSMPQVSEKATAKKAPQRQTRIQQRAESPVRFSQQAASPKQSARTSTTQALYHTNTTTGKSDLSQAITPVASASYPAMNKPVAETTATTPSQENTTVVTSSQIEQAVQPLALSPWQEIRSAMQPEAEPLQPWAPVKKPAVAKKRNDLLIRPNFEMGYALKTLKDRVEGDSNIVYVNARKATEEALEYLHGSLMLGMRHHSGWYALTGLGYTRITERFAFTTARSEIDSVPGITEIYINAQGDSVLTEGMVERTRHITYRKRTYSSYTLLDVPLIVGYDWEKGPWSFGAEAGVFFNLSLKAQGDALDPGNNIIRLEESDWFKKSIGLSYYGSVRVGYALDKKTRVSLGPVFRYVPDIADTRPSHAIQKYGLLGLNLGISRRF